MKLISRLAPQSTNPTAFFFLTSAQYLTHRPQSMQNEDSFSRKGELEAELFERGRDMTLENELSRFAKDTL